MNEQTLITLFSATALWLLSLTSIVYWIKGDVKKIRLAVELFIDGMGKGAAKVLHSPDDHLGIDKFLDKYIQNHHDLPYQDWEKLKVVCERVVNDVTISIEDRLAASTVLASMVAQLSLHKMGNVPNKTFRK